MIDRLKAAGARAKQEMRVYRLLARDPRTPLLPKALLGLAVAYFFLPFDILPDFLPVVGQLDDLILIPSLVLLSLKMIPRELVEEHREAVRAELSPHP